MHPSGLVKWSYLEKDGGLEPKSERFVPEEVAWFSFSALACTKSRKQMYHIIPDIKFHHEARTARENGHQRQINKAEHISSDSANLPNNYQIIPGTSVVTREREGERERGMHETHSLSLGLDVHSSHQILVTQYFRSRHTSSFPCAAC